MLVDQSKTSLQSHYDKNCFNKKECLIDLTEFTGSNNENFNTECRAKLQNRIDKSKFKKDEGSSLIGKNNDPSVAEPIIFGRAMCFSEKIKVPFTNYELKKEDLGIYVVMIDFIVILIILLWIYIISARLEEFVDSFKADTIQMDDYTIKVKNLPKDALFGNDELILKA